MMIESYYLSGEMLPGRLVPASLVFDCRVYLVRLGCLSVPRRWFMYFKLSSPIGLLPAVALSRNRKTDFLVTLLPFQNLTQR